MIAHRIVMRGDFTGISGYARCTREYAQALIESGIDLRIENNKKEATTPNISPFWSEELPKRIVQEDAPCKIKIWHETPQFWKPRENVFNIGYTTFECFSIPDVPIKGMLSYNWVAQCNRMDLIMVPSKFNKRTFIESGVTTPIEVIPHIIPEAPLPRPEPYFPADPKATRYLSIFQWNPRKDPMSLLIAFWLASVKNSRLLLKTYDAGFNEKNAGLVTHIRAIKDSFHINVSGVVNPILNKLSSEEIDKLIATADVYVTSTRGEGFGLPPVESMMAGIPVIGPYGTALEDYVSEETGYPVEWSLVPTSGMEQLSYGVWYSPRMQWMQVDVYSLAAAIKKADEDSRTECLLDGEKTSVLKAKGRKAQIVARNLSGRDKVLPKYLSILGSITPKVN